MIRKSATAAPAEPVRGTGAKSDPTDHVARLAELAGKAAQSLRIALEHAEVQAGLDRKMIEYLEHQIRVQDALIAELRARISELEGDEPWKR